MKSRRVVVTGLGLVSPLGTKVQYAWKRLLAGESATTKLDAPEYASIPCKVAALVPRGTDETSFDIDAVSKSDRKYLSLSMIYALHATEQALTDAKWKPGSKAEKERTGVCLGMGMVDLQDVLSTGSDLNRGYSKVSPFFIPRILPNLAAGHVSLKYGFQGPNHCVSTACTTGLHAIGDASRFIQYGDADVMVCGATEAAVNPLSIAAFARMRALSTGFNEDPQSASRPFDVRRDGFVMGEGSGVLVLEELSHAEKRGAKIYAEVLGYGLSADAYHITTPREDGGGAILCMSRAMEHSGVQPEEVGYVNCHATSTPIGDKVEAGAIAMMFVGDPLETLSVSSTKGATGHLLGAAGAIESVFTVLACHTGDIPPTANLKYLDPAIHKLSIVSKSSVRWDPKFRRRVAIKNSFGFGGTNASICFAQMT
ncbi:hypothetical protein RvY_13571 [Ramazzottius varieornatus]|uniref:3-oxoacyl-[acyl-carrier-protein] synthase n=1 Tax=Ramazzottius varieornatus TaxID=947166 RepID=A0A1D1VQ54_RAMVA|nr:hypothetical protein RvY_13571 [Ramazzottius varieornatus]